MFSTVFFSLDAFKIFLFFKAGLFIGLSVEKCAACESHWKSDFGWHRVHLAWCVRGLKSVKRFCPYLIAFWSCISTGKPEWLCFGCFVVVSFSFFFSGFMKSSAVYAAKHVCKIWDNGSDLVSGLTSSLNFKKPSDIFWPKIERKRSE